MNHKTGHHRSTELKTRTTSAEVGQGSICDEFPFQCWCVTYFTYYDILGCTTIEQTIAPNPLETSLDSDFHLNHRQIYSQG